MYNLSTILGDHRELFLDHSNTALEMVAKIISHFLNSPDVVKMIDGRKRTTMYQVEQNRDYDKWTGIINRDVLLVWDLLGWNH